MKISYAGYFFLLILLHHSITNYGQENNHLTGVKVNPLGGVASALPLSIERFMFQHRFSVVAGGSLIHSSSGTGDNYYLKGGFTINPELRYYLSNDMTKDSRTYAGAWFNYEEHTNGSNDRLGNLVKGKIYGRGAGLLFGNQWFFKNRFLVDLYFGPGYISYSKNENYDLNVSKGGFLVSITGPKQGGMKVRFGFTVGLAF